jgi:hypothetical protein
MGSIVGQEVGGLVGVDGNELIGESKVNRGVGGRCIIAVVFVVGDGMVGRHSTTRPCSWIRGCSSATPRASTLAMAVSVMGSAIHW